MSRYERLNALLELLSARGSIEVEDLVAELGASSATIRRDLDHLAQQMLLTRTYGGAVSNSTAYDLPLRYKAARHATEKQRIAKVAASLVTPGSVVCVNGGTTTTEVARALASIEEGVTLVTNALNIAHELVVRPNLKIVMVGGVVRSQSYELMGPLATAILERLAIDVAIIGVDAIDVELGAQAHHEGEASINWQMAARAKQVVVVADGSKLGKRAFAQICPLSKVDILVTEATPEETEPFEKAGVQVLRA